MESACSPKVSVQKDYVAERLPPTDDQMFRVRPECDFRQANRVLVAKF